LAFGTSYTYKQGLALLKKKEIMAPRTRKTRRKPSASTANNNNGSENRRKGIQTEAKSSQSSRIEESFSRDAAVKNNQATSPKREEACPPDCKCLLRGRGFFLPAGMEDDAKPEETSRS